MKKINRYIVLSVIMISILLFGASGLFIYVEQKDQAEIINTIERGERLLLPSICMSSMVDGIVTLNESEQSEFAEVYRKELNEVYVEGCAPQKMRLSILESFLSDSPTVQEIAYAIETYEVHSLEIEDDQAVIDISFADSIRSVNLNEENEYTSMVSQTNNRLKVTLLKSEGKWKISSCEILNYQPSSSDEIQSENFSSYQAAENYAVQTQV